MDGMPLLLDTSTQVLIAGVLSLTIPVMCLALVLAWWGVIIRRRGGLD